LSDEKAIAGFFFQQCNVQVWEIICVVAVVVAVVVVVVAAVDFFK